MNRSIKTFTSWNWWTGLKTFTSWNWWTGLNTWSKNESDGRGEEGVAGEGGYGDGDLESESDSI